MIIKKLVFIFSFLSLFLFLATIFSGIHWGIFSSINFTLTHQKKMYFITTKNSTYYLNVQTQIDSVKNYLELKKITLTYPAIIIRDEPNYSSLKILQVNGGFIYTDSFLIEDTMFTSIILDSGKVMIGRMRANFYIAPYKLYPALSERFHDNEFRRDSSRVIVQILKTSDETEVIYPLHPISQIPRGGSNS